MESCCMATSIAEVFGSRFMVHMLVNIMQGIYHGATNIVLFHLAHLRPCEDALHSSDLYRKREALRLCGPYSSDQLPPAQLELRLCDSTFVTVAKLRKHHIRQ